jgi:hypothetical protein
MGALPIDFQVLFSKLSEHSELLARQQQVAQYGQIQAREAAHQKSIEAPRTVSELDAYAQDFTKVDPEASSGGQYQHENEKRETHPIQEEKKNPPLEEGKGQIIDIVD